MTIIVRDGKYINTETQEDNKKLEMIKLGERVTKANRTTDHKKRSTLLLKKALTILNPIAEKWASREDLQKTLEAIKESIEKDHLSNHLRTFVFILETLENIIPLIKLDKEKPALIKLQKEVLSHNKERREEDYKKETSRGYHSHPIRKQKSHLTTGDIDRWIQTSKRGDRLVYYTGHTFDNKEFQAKKVFDHVRNLCFKFEPIAANKKYIKVYGANEWGMQYHDIITLFQQKVAPEQKDKEKNVITYAIYNYVMEKL
tara:strand:+ start:40 stop:813 length:774 start_codon:yes stop_codon:yes gene_type:complete